MDDKGRTTIFGGGRGTEFGQKGLIIPKEEYQDWMTFKAPLVCSGWNTTFYRTLSRFIMGKVF